jgi:hypothetical protein
VLLTGSDNNPAVMTAETRLNDLDLDDVRKIWVRWTRLYLRKKGMDVEPVPEKVYVDSLASLEWRDVNKRENGSRQPTDFLFMPFKWPSSAD